MKRLILIGMIALMSGVVEASTNTTNAIENVSDICPNKKSKRYKTKRGSKRKQKRNYYSSQHSWSKVSVGRTCNKKRRR